MGGALAEEPPMPKLEFREKECLENFGIFAKALNCYLFWALLTWLKDDCPLLARKEPVMPQGYFCPLLPKNPRVTL
ncbi:hypothetical protein DVH24_035662 [Malus domestica]|uniref:Uncharacterized protein n=1 Tax=Malus domestica TaxID=3750 RepID=A0A498JT44_MALDO|nr:hypothetical protein DVH24_035662 [Malus domestica]